MENRENSWYFLSLEKKIFRKLMKKKSMEFFSWEFLYFQTTLWLSQFLN